jgi:UDP-N-acetylglucosamine 2-epimerase (non-hydrolysing)
MKVLVSASTRPEVIKLSPVLKELQKRRITSVFATTGQHYDHLLFKKFIEELNLKNPSHNIEVGSASQAVQTGKAMMGIEEVLLKELPDVVVVEGDTNSVLACALASIKAGIPVAHVEAGLRSFDRSMPEEVNRILTDHCSELLFAPTENSALNLINEGISPEKIHIVGNTIVDATLENIRVAKNTSKILKKLPENYVLLTLHRQENTDDAERLEEVLTALRELGRDVLFPIHPRTEKIVKNTSLEKHLKSKNIHLMPPLGYFDFLLALKNAYTVLTDSGGVQEEAIILNTPCLTLRYNTERPESVWAGGNVVVGTKKKEILENFNKLSQPRVYEKIKGAKNPFGDGKTGARIVDILVKKIERKELLIKSSDTRESWPDLRIISVDERLSGKKIGESGLEIQKIIEKGRIKFPYPNASLERGQQIVLKKKANLKNPFLHP